MASVSKIAQIRRIKLFAIINLGCWESFVIVCVILLSALIYYGKKVAVNEHAQKLIAEWLEKRANRGKEQESKG
jgi:hypothetical protein